jgi:hypothetical protein
MSRSAHKHDVGAATVGLLVFAGNLILPFSWGWQITKGNSRLGMVLGTIAWLIAWLFACSRPGRMRLTLIFGGAAVAWSQVIALLQILAGFIGLWLGKALFFGADPLNTLIGTFVVTMTTGGILIGAAMIVGYPLSLLVELPGPVNQADSGSARDTITSTAAQSN